MYILYSTPSDNFLFIVLYITAFYVLYMYINSKQWPSPPGKQNEERRAEGIQVNTRTIIIYIPFARLATSFKPPFVNLPRT